MRAPTRESTRESMIRILALVLTISIGFLVPKAAAQSDKYPKMAPADQYLMERDAEILLARSAAPDSISSDATILVLGRQVRWAGRNLVFSSKLVYENTDVAVEAVWALSNDGKTLT